VINVGDDSFVNIASIRKAESNMYRLQVQDISVRNNMCARRAFTYKQDHETSDKLSQIIAEYIYGIW